MHIMPLTGVSLPYVPCLEGCCRSIPPRTALVIDFAVAVCQTAPGHGWAGEEPPEAQGSADQHDPISAAAGRRHLSAKERKLLKKVRSVVVLSVDERPE